MQIVRTIVWVVVLFALLAFSFFNWRPVDVIIWPGMVLDTKLPALVIISFLLGLLPMWLIHRGSKWSMRRRIAALETATTRMNTAEPVGTAPQHPDRPPLHETPATTARPRDLPDEPRNPVEPEPTKPA